MPTGVPGASSVPTSAMVTRLSEIEYDFSTSKVFPLCWLEDAFSKSVRSAQVLFRWRYTTKCWKRFAAART